MLEMEKVLGNFRRISEENRQLLAEKDKVIAEKDRLIKLNLELLESFSSNNSRLYEKLHLEHEENQNLRQAMLLAKREVWGFYEWAEKLEGDFINKFLK